MLRNSEQGNERCTFKTAKYTQAALHFQTGVYNDIADAVRRLRRRIEKVLLERANAQCGRQDVSTNDRKYGYCLSPKNTACDPNDVRNDPDHDGNDVRNDVNHDVTNGQNDPRNSPRDVKNLSARQQWILDELGVRGAMQKDELLHGYQGQFCLSKTTLERDLKTLRSRNLIRFEGGKRTGRWRPL